MITENYRLGLFCFCEYNKIYQDGIEYQIHAEGGNNSLSGGYLGDDNLYPVKLTVNWSDPRPQQLTLETYILTND